MYKNFFGLHRNPFELSPDPSFMCPSEKSQEALASIMTAVVKRKGFVVMTGEVGTGKTLILRSLFQLWRREQIAFANIVAPNLSVAEFLSSAALDLGIEVREPTKGNLLRGLYDFIVAQFEKGLTTVLVVDEAHQLPTSVLEEIRMLTNVETDQQKLVQVVLVGQPELDKKLDSFELRQLKQRIAIRCHLEPLREEETRRYIECRLNLAGASAEAKTIFPPETTKAIYSYSQGIPRLINSVSERALITAYARQIRVVPVEIINEVASYLRLQDLTATKRAPWPLQHREDSIGDMSWQIAAGVRASGAKTSDPDTFSADLGTRRGTSAEVTPPNRPKTLCEDSLRDIPDVTQQEAPAPLHAQTEAEYDPLGRDSREFGGLDLASPNREAQATLLPPDRSALSAPTTSVTETCPSAPIQHSRPATESIFLAPEAPQLATCEPGKGQTVASAADLRAIFQPDQVLRDTSPSQLRRWLEPVPRLSLTMSAAAVVVVALMTGVIMARRQKGAVTALHQVASTLATFPVGQAAASIQPAGASSATQFDVASGDLPLARTDSGTESTGALEHLTPRTKIVMGTLSRPVVPSSYLSTSTEPPQIMGIGTNELELGKGLLDVPVSGPNPPGGVSHLQPPKLVSSPPPSYPSLVRVADVQGIAVIKALVDETGKVTDMKVISGSPVLTQVAMEALRAWKYEPARLDGQPIAAYVQVSINFSPH